MDVAKVCSGHAVSFRYNRGQSLQLKTILEISLAYVLKNSQTLRVLCCFDRISVPRDPAQYVHVAKFVLDLVGYCLARHVIVR